MSLNDSPTFVLKASAVAPFRVVCGFLRDATGAIVITGAAGA